MTATQPRRTQPGSQELVPLHCCRPPTDKTRSRRLLALAAAALLPIGFPTAAAPTAAPHADTRQPRPAVPVLLETTDTTPVDLRVGPHRFRIPRHYFRHPPSRSGVDDGFALRVLLPGMEAITEANRHVFRMPFSTEEGRRKAWVVYEHRADLPQDGARWRLGNSARSRVSGLEDFQAASEATHGLRALIDPPLLDKPWAHRLPDLYWSSLPGGDLFVGLSCSGAPPSEFATCTLLLDWGGRPLSTYFDRRELARWREIAAVSIELMNHLSVGGDEGRPR